MEEHCVINNPCFSAFENVYSPGSGSGIPKDRF